MSTIAIIPARGGSKGIPKKNLVQVCGKPLLEWSIKQAKETSQIDGVMVTTDSQDIAKVAIDCGAEVFWRSPETATDGASSESALLEVLQCLGNDTIVFLQATSPCRLSMELDYAISLFAEQKADSLFSARVVHGYVWQVASDQLWQRESRRPRQQRQVLNLEENGSFYIFHARGLIESRNRLHGKIVPFLQHPLCGYQIDERGDIPIVEQCMRWLNVAS